MPKSGKVSAKQISVKQNMTAAELIRAMRSSANVDTRDWGLYEIAAQIAEAKDWIREIGFVLASRLDQQIEILQRQLAIQEAFERKINEMDKKHKHVHLHRPRKLKRKR